MNIKELIEKLQQIAEQHPDCTVTCDCDYEGVSSPVDVEDLTYNEKDNTVYIE